MFALEPLTQHEGILGTDGDDQPGPDTCSIEH
jgi:hypothetical protein